MSETVELERLLELLAVELASDTARAQSRDQHIRGRLREARVAEVLGVLRGSRKAGSVELSS